MGNAFGIDSTHHLKCARDGPGWNGSQKSCVALTMVLTEYKGVFVVGEHEHKSPLPVIRRTENCFLLG